jgi:hypothetical protein
MAKYTCCSSVALERPTGCSSVVFVRPYENTFTVTTPGCQMSLTTLLSLPHPPPVIAVAHRNPVLPFIADLQAITGTGAALSGVSDGLLSLTVSPGTVRRASPHKTALQCLLGHCSSARTHLAWQRVPLARCTIPATVSSLHAPLSPPRRRFASWQRPPWMTNPRSWPR